ncbi:MAG: hypothetical protein HY062_16885 [Bacteroidetes bacterium]|nr:hypothetical protein [Bacteroidota bacterium]
MKKISYLLFVIVALLACDPALRGDLKVFNHCSRNITIKYIYDKDSVQTDIQASSYITVKQLGGLGRNSTFDCCPCYSTIISISKDTVPIRKDITKSESWIIPNKQALKQRRLFKQTDVKCELHIYDSDF